MRAHNTIVQPAYKKRKKGKKTHFWFFINEHHVHHNRAKLLTSWHQRECSLFTTRIVWNSGIVRDPRYVVLSSKMSWLQVSIAYNVKNEARDRARKLLLQSYRIEQCVNTARPNVILLEMFDNLWWVGFFRCVQAYARACREEDEEEAKEES